jgi:hypothetical protein
MVSTRNAMKTLGAGLENGRVVEDITEVLGYVYCVTVG